MFTVTSVTLEEQRHILAYVIELASPAHEPTAIHTQALTQACERSTDRNRRLPLACLRQGDYHIWIPHHLKDQLVARPTWDPNGAFTSLLSDFELPASTTEYLVLRPQLAVSVTVTNRTWARSPIAGRRFSQIRARPGAADTPSSWSLPLP
jgi:hypothetical protein